jgi:hypothetical protein
MSPAQPFSEKYLVVEAAAVSLDEETGTYLVKVPVEYRQALRADERANVLNEAVAADGFLSARHAREWEDFVRKDEREKSAERVAGVDREHQIYQRPTCNDLMAAAIDAARGERPEPRPGVQRIGDQDPANRRAESSESATEASSRE